METLQQVLLLLWQIIVGLAILSSLMIIRGYLQQIVVMMQSTNSFYNKRVMTKGEWEAEELRNKIKKMPEEKLQTDHEGLVSEL